MAMLRSIKITLVNRMHNKFKNCQSLRSFGRATDSHWGVIAENDIEREHAFNMFIGKSEEEAMDMCLQNAQNYQDELQAMPFIPFNFYAPILAKYIISSDAKEDSDGASSYLSMVAWMLKTQESIIRKETKDLLITSAEFVSKNQSFYDASFEIYGDFQDKYMEIKKCT